MTPQVGETWRATGKSRPQRARVTRVFGWRAPPDDDPVDCLNFVSVLKGGRFGEWYFTTVEAFVERYELDQEAPK